MLHVLALPHTQTTRAYDSCAYTSKVRKFATMMTRQGYDVVLYGGEDNEAECAEFVPCITRAEQAGLLSGYEWFQRGEFYGVPYNDSEPVWAVYLARVIDELSERISERDIICLSSGTQKPVMDAFSAHLTVETGVGYEGTCAPHRVFESYAWMHTVYGAQQGATAADGHFFDAVIPNFFEPEDFPLGADPEPYCLFMSRMTPRKGYEIAIEATRRAGVVLKIAGAGGDRPAAHHVEYVGLADPIKRAELMGNATALLAPTHYLEPFGGVVVEAAMCGTPAITTDWGAFSETVEDGLSGYRCRTLREFVDAIEATPQLDRVAIHKRAVETYSLAAIGPQYDRHFKRLQSLWGQGFYEMEDTC